MTYTSSSSTMVKGEHALTHPPAPKRTMHHMGSLLGGSALVLYALKKRSLGSLFLAGVGAGLVYRSLSENEFLSDGGIKRLALNLGATEGIEIERSVTVNRPIEEVYKFWHNFENLPRFMHYIDSVEMLDKERSRWKVHLPRLKAELQWEAKLLDERENELIAWRSVEGSDIFNEGFVSFTEAPGDRGTEVHARIVYRPPAGAAGQAVVELFNALPTQAVKEDLRHFKHIMEAGEVPTIKGQSSAHHRLSGMRKRVAELEDLEQQEPQERQGSREILPPTLH